MKMLIFSCQFIQLLLTPSVDLIISTRIQFNSLIKYLLPLGFLSILCLLFEWINLSWINSKDNKQCKDEYVVYNDWIYWFQCQQWNKFQTEILSWFKWTSIEDNTIVHRIPLFVGIFIYFKNEECQSFRNTG